MRNSALLCFIYAAISLIAHAQHSVTVELPSKGADVSIAVRDTRFTDGGSPTSSLVADLLLESELRGAVEDVDWYFDPSAPARQRSNALDALMLTQGWSRYDIPAALAGRYAEPEGFLEVMSEISGTVKSRWKGTPLKDCSVAFIAPSMTFGNSYPTDAEGRFAMNDFDFPDKTTFIVQARNAKGDIEANFDLDPERFPSVGPLAGRFQPSLLAAAAERGDDDTTAPDYTWRLTHSNGMMSIKLGEVVVRGVPSSASQEEIFELLGAPKTDYKSFEEKHITTYEEAIREIPGLIMMNGAITRGRRPVEIWIDGVRFERNGELQHVDFSSKYQLSSAGGGTLGPSSKGGPLQYSGVAQIPSPDLLQELQHRYPFSTIKSVQYFQPYMSAIFSASGATGGGILMFTTKDGSEGGVGRNWLLQAVTPLGYQRKREFYVPKYELESKYDTNMRPTLYWIPRASSAEGSVTLALPPSVESATVVVEGFRADGRPVSELREVKIVKP